MPFCRASRSCDVAHLMPLLAISRLALICELGNLFFLKMRLNDIRKATTAINPIDNNNIFQIIAQVFYAKIGKFTE